MREILLYDADVRLPIETAAARDRDPSCARCDASKTARRHRCVRAEWTGQPGGVLLVGDYPAKSEDAADRPMVGEMGRYVRRVLKREWGDRPVAFDNAVRCMTPSATPTMIQRCCPYLAKTLEESQPSRVVAMGASAIYAITGRTLPPLSVRKGFAWLSTGVPVFFTMSPIMAVRNMHLRRWFEEDFRHALHGDLPCSPAWGGRALVVENAVDALEAIAALRKARAISFDCETAGEMHSPFQIVCLAASGIGQDDAYVWGNEGLSDPGAYGPLQDLLADPAVPKVGQNVKYDERSVLLDLNVRVAGVVDDTRLTRRLLEPDADADLETMAELVGMGGHKAEAQEALKSACKSAKQIGRSNESSQEDLFPLEVTWAASGLRRDVARSIKRSSRPEAFAYGLIPRDVCYRYCARDTVSTGKLHRALADRLDIAPKAIARVRRKIVMPAAAAVVRVEEWGVAVDLGAADVLRAHLATSIQAVEEEIQSHAPGINPGSPDQVSELLFGRLGLPVIEETKTGKPSVAKSVLSALRHRHPVVPLLRERSRLAKVRDAYATGLFEHVRDDGRVHPSILLDGAVSGRTSVVDPPLQTLPKDVKSVEGRMVRNCFVAERGWTLVHADLSQIELRVAAVLSGDSVMAQIFRDGVDYHQRTAENVCRLAWGIEPDQVEKQHRSASKAINFGLLYGKGDASLAYDLGCSTEEAAKIRAAILGRFSVLARWIKGSLTYARRHGECWTWWEGEDARRRPLWRIADGDSATRSRAENGAHNTRIQGTASDFLVAALAAVVQWILDENVPAKVVLPIHDALLIEARDDAVAEVCGVVPDIMTGWDSAGVPIEVDVETGPAFGSLEKWRSGAQDIGAA